MEKTGITAEDTPIPQSPLKLKFDENPDLSLDNIMSILESAFPYLEGLKDRNIIVPWGWCGSGKSTVLNSLVFGPDKLEISKISDIKVLKGMAKKTHNRSVIDQKQELKE